MTDKDSMYGLEQTPTGVESFLFIIGIIVLIAAFIVGFAAWPSYASSAFDYLAGLSFIFSGIFTFSIFLAISKHLQNQRKLL